MRKTNNLKIFFGAPIALFSIEAYLGMVIGYFSALFFSPKLKSLVLHLGKYKLHLHHWLLALGILPLILFYKVSPIPIQLASGFLGGLIFQGIVCYDDWYRVVIKKKEED